MAVMLQPRNTGKVDAGPVLVVAVVLVLAVGVAGYSPGQR
jgi:hypothetical protein